MRRIGVSPSPPSRVAVDADDDPLAAVDLALELVRRVGDLALREAALDRLDHAAELVDLAKYS
jgi:hypothetical protein